MRFLLLGSILLFLVLYLTREMRDLTLPSFQALLPPSWQPGSARSHPQQVHSQEDAKETHEAMKEKTALEEWIQSRLTQKGLADMTESGSWQGEQASVL
jgi:hypothetical protein